MGGSSKKVTVGYKYYAGMHMALCHGPVDRLARVRVGGKQAWLGTSTGGAVQIDAPNLFGGEKREGGVTGQVDIEMGGPTQGQNSYLAAKLGADMLPAFRGVCCAVLRQVYIGLNPYLKDWGWLLQRINLRSGGVEQWYPTKAAIPVPGAEAYVLRTVIADSITMSAIWSRSTTLEPGNAEWLPADANPEHFDLDPTKTYAVEFLDTGPRKALSLNTTTGNYWSTYVSVSYDNSGEWSGNLGNTSQYSSEELAFQATVGNKYSFSGKSAVDFYIRDGPTEGYLTDNDGGVTFRLVRIENIDAILDMNPAHIIRECLTDAAWGMGYPEEDMGDSFMAAADSLYAEGMGISILWSQQTSIEDFVEEILRHIDAVLYVDRATGKFEIKLIRDDYDEATLLILDQSNISRVEGYSKQTLAELVNEITVSYDSHETGQTETVTLQNLAMIQQQGAIIPASVEYPGFSHQGIAAKAAARDLKAMSTPLVTATIYANRKAAGLNIGSCFVWNWVETDEGGNGVATSYIMRVTEIAFGDGVDNAVRIQCAQDVFALPDIVYVEAEPTEWADPSVPPLPATPRLVAEAPYYEIVQKLGEVDAAAKLASLPELGYLMVAAGRPSAEINAEIQVDSGAGYAEGGVLDFCPCAKLDGAIGYLDTTVTIKDGVDLDEFVAGSLAQIDDEIVVVESIIGDVATIRRGCLDTIPETHADGAAVIIWDGYWSSDDVEYIDSDELDVKILTTTASDQLALVNAPGDYVQMSGRALRPYPPANVQINGEYFPASLTTSGNIYLTWAHRDRTQQTGGEIVGWTDGSIGPEAGLAYDVVLKREDSGVTLASGTGVSDPVFTASDVTYNGDIRVELLAVRGGVASNLYAHVFDHFRPSETWQPDGYTSLYLSVIDTSSLILNGSTVSQWSDKSGNDRHATNATAGQQATYVNGVLSFDAAVSPNYDLYNLPLAEYGALFFVVKKTNANTKGFLSRDSRDYDRDGILIYSTGETRLQNNGSGNAITAGPIATIGQWNIVYAEANGTTRSLRVNGGAAVSVAHTAKINMNQIGFYHYQPPTWCFEGQMAFVIGLADAPDQTLRQKIEGFLAHAMNNELGIADIVNALATDHPYKINPPV